MYTNEEGYCSLSRGQQPTDASLGCTNTPRYESYERLYIWPRPPDIVCIEAKGLHTVVFLYFVIDIDAYIGAPMELDYRTARCIFVQGTLSHMWYGMRNVEFFRKSVLATIFGGYEYFNKLTVTPK